MTASKMEHIATKEEKARKRKLEKQLVETEKEITDNRSPHKRD